MELGSPNKPQYGWDDPTINGPTVFTYYSNNKIFHISFCVLHMYFTRQLIIKDASVRTMEGALYSFLKLLWLYCDFIIPLVCLSDNAWSVLQGPVLLICLEHISRSIHERVHHWKTWSTFWRFFAFGRFSFLFWRFCALGRCTRIIWYCAWIWRKCVSGGITGISCRVQVGIGILFSNWYLLVVCWPVRSSKHWCVLISLDGWTGWSRWGDRDTRESVTFISRLALTLIRTRYGYTVSVRTTPGCTVYTFLSQTLWIDVDEASSTHTHIWFNSVNAICINITQARYCTIVKHTKFSISFIWRITSANELPRFLDTAGVWIAYQSYLTATVLSG